MKLFMIHCGFYDRNLAEGVYESHINYFIAAENFDDAKKRAKDIPEFREKHMHIDGLQEISAASGYRIALSEDAELKGETVVLTNRQ